MTRTAETLLQVPYLSAQTFDAGPDIRFLQSVLAVMVIATLLIGGVCIDLLLDLPAQNLSQLASR